MAADLLPTPNRFTQSRMANTPPGLDATGTGADTVGTGMICIEHGSPSEKLFIDSFTDRVRDEPLNVAEFGSLLEAQVVVEARRAEFNTCRSHSALGGRTAVEYAEHWTITTKQRSRNHWTTQRVPSRGRASPPCASELALPADHPPLRLAEPHPSLR